MLHLPTRRFPTDERFGNQTVLRSRTILEGPVEVSLRLARVVAFVIRSRLSVSWPPAPASMWASWRECPKDESAGHTRRRTWRPELAIRVFGAREEVPRLENACAT